MKVLKFAAIDIGSNAIRLLFTNVMVNGGQPSFKKSSLIRVPLRLGHDAFLHHIITDKTYERLEHTMKAFYHLIQVHEPVAYRACATSAMREAANGEEIVKSIRKNAGIKIEVIDGKEEAEIIFSNGLAQSMDPAKTYLYIDVGGGSTELTIFSRNKSVASRSFNIGTIRLLNEQVSKAEWKFLRSWVKQHTAPYKNISVIGSGGNINKMYKLTGKKELMPVSYEEMRSIHTTLSNFTVEERMQHFDLNPDRADVIVPAADIFVSLMKWAQADNVYVPKIGVSDGLVRQLFYKYQRKQDKAFR